MKVIYNKYIPTKNFTAINLFGLIFARREYKELSKREINHEKIHSWQILELLGPIYYIVYIVEWIIRLLQYRNAIDAYRNISFEREAYKNDSDLNYLRNRKPFAFRHYLVKEK